MVTEGLCGREAHFWLRTRPLPIRSQAFPAPGSEGGPRVWVYRLLRATLT